MIWAAGFEDREAVPSCRRGDKQLSTKYIPPRKRLIQNDLTHWNIDELIINILHLSQFLPLVNSPFFGPISMSVKMWGGRGLP